jgi:hypothetical protein
MLARIHCDWKTLRPDLRHSTSEARNELLDFATVALRLHDPLGSLRELTAAQLGRLIEAMARDRAQPRLEGCLIHHVRPADVAAASAAASGGEVVHLATPEQAWALNRVLGFLGWSPEGREQFLKKNFRRTTPRMLTPKQASSALTILLGIAASRELKEAAAAEGRGEIKVSRAMIRAEIPALKLRLGIDAGRAFTTEDTEDTEGVL